MENDGIGNFFNDGYVVIRKVFDADVVADVAAFLSEAHETLRRNGSRQNEGELVQSGHFPLDVRLSQRLWAFPRQERLQSILREVLKSWNVYMHMPPTARFVESGNRVAAVPPHQDMSYNKHLSDFVTVWTPLTPIDADRGGVAVFEGSQGKSELLEDHERRIWLKPVSTVGYRRVECRPMVPGDVLLLNPRIIHESMANRSSHTRISIDMRFFGERGRSTRHYLDCQTWKVIVPEEAT